MAALTWDSDPVSDGLERVVLFPPSAQGVPWNGLSSVTPEESGSSTTQYFDGIPYLIATSDDSYSANLEAFTYPGEFEQCESYPHAIFGLSYRETTNADGYLLHLVWNATAAPTVKAWASRSGQIELSQFSWAITTVPDSLEGVWPVSHLVVDSATAPPEAIVLIEEALYGTESTGSYLPAPQEVLTLFQDNPWVRITDLGDGTFEIEGPEELVRQIDATTWDVESGGITFIDDDEYDITSW